MAFTVGNLIGIVIALIGLVKLDIKYILILILYDQIIYLLEHKTMPKGYYIFKLFLYIVIVIKFFNYYK